MQQRQIGKGVTVPLGSYMPMDLIRLSDIAMYAVLEEVFDDRYDISDATFKFIGSANEDGYIDVVAVIKEYERIT